MSLAIKLKTAPSVPEKTPAPPPVVEPSPIPPESGRALVDRAKYEDITRRLVMGQKTVDIAADVGYSERQLRRIMHRDEFIEVFERVSAHLNQNLDEILLDEKMRPLHRIQAGSIRAITALHEIQEEVRQRIKDGTARATDLKVGADTAFGIIDRSKGELSPEGTTTAAVSFNINADKKTLLRTVVKEAGVDLSDLGLDVIDVTPLEDVPPKEITTDGE